MTIFGKTAVGLDISDDSIEVVEIKKTGSTVTVLNKNRVTIPEEFIVDGKIQDVKGLGVLIREAFDKAQPKAIVSKNVYTFFPENLTYTAVVRIEAGKGMSTTKLNEHFQAQVPFPLQDTVHTHFVRSQQRGVSTVLFYAVARGMFTQWNTFFREHDVDVAGYEPEMFAAFRALKTTPEQKAQKGEAGKQQARSIRAIIDLGAESTTIALYDAQGLVGTYASSVGGDWITRGVAKALDLDIDKAEEKKKTLTFSGSGKGATVLKEAFDEIAVVFRDLIDYYADDGELRVTEVLLIGGGADFKGVEKYCSDLLEVPVSKGVYDTSRITVKEGSKLSHLYMGAVGVALRGVDKQWADSILLEPKEVAVTRRTTPAARQAVTRRTQQRPQKIQSLTQQEPSFLKQHAKELMLVVILLLGAAALVGGYWYRLTSQVRDAAQQVSPGFSLERTTTIAIPVIVAPSQYASDAVRGKLVIKSILDQETAGGALEQQRAELAGELLQGEAVWGVPIRAVTAAGAEVDLAQAATVASEEFPILVTWLVYAQQEVTAVALGVLSEALGEQQYIYDTLEINDVRSRDSILMSMTVDVAYLLDKPAALPDMITHERLVGEVVIDAEVPPEVLEGDPQEDDAIVDEVVAPTPSVEILVTGTGFLNVRSGAGTSFPIVTQVTPGDIYPFDEIQNGWYHISIDDDTDGWVVGTFVREE